MMVCEVDSPAVSKASEKTRRKRPMTVTKVLDAERKALIGG